MLTSDSRAPISYNVPFRLADASMDNIERKWAEEVKAAKREKRGALILGPTGVGKTGVLVAAMKFVGGPSLYVDWPQFCEDIGTHDKMRTEDKAKFDPKAFLFPRTINLFIDDAGAEHRVASGFRAGEYESAFDQFISYRWGLPFQLWMTTNLTSKGIRERYGERTMSRIIEHCRLIQMDGPDRRLR